MIYVRRMDTTELLASLYVVSENISQLLHALDDFGYQGLDVRKIDGGYGLFLDDTLLAAGIDDNEVEATEILLDRAADMFYHDIPEGKGSAVSTTYPEDDRVWIRCHCGPWS